MSTVKSISAPMGFVATSTGTTGADLEKDPLTVQLRTMPYKVSTQEDVDAGKAQTVGQPMATVFVAADLYPANHKKADKRGKPNVTGLRIKVSGRINRLFDNPSLIGTMEGDYEGQHGLFIAKLGETAALPQLKERVTS